MNSSNHRFTLDLRRTQSQISIPALVGDTSRTIHISFTDGDGPYVIEDGCLAKLAIKRPTGTFLEEFCEIRNNTTVVYHFSQNTNTCAVEGIHNCDVTLYGLDGEIIGSPRFTIVVNEKVISEDDINLSDDDKSAVDAMLLAEAARKDAEIARVNAETARVNAETARADAEAARVSAETERNQRFNELLAKLDFSPIYSSIVLFASAWEGEDSLYSQVVKFDGVTPNSKVDLLPSIEQLAIFYDKDIAFVAENEDGVVTVYAIGDKPTQDYTMEVVITEVRV